MERADLENFGCMVTLFFAGGAFIVLVLWSWWQQRRLDAAGGLRSARVEQGDTRAAKSEPARVTTGARSNGRAAPRPKPYTGPSAQRASNAHTPRLRGGAVQKPDRVRRDDTSAVVDEQHAPLPLFTIYQGKRVDAVQAADGTFCIACEGRVVRFTDERAMRRVMRGARWRRAASDARKGSRP